MKKFWGWLCRLDAGEGIALAVLSAGLLIVGWETISGIWSAVVGSLQPEMVKVKGTDYDLIAQRSMSAAAWWMVIITGISALVGSLGLYLIARTLQEAKRSADAAEKAVKASQKAVKTARKMGEAQVRAYVMVANAELYWVGGDEWELKVQVVNSGQTPAFKVWVEATICLEDGLGNQEIVEEMDVSLHDLPASSDAAARLRSRKLEVALQAMEADAEPFLAILISVCYDTIFEEGEDVEAPYYGTQSSHFAPFELTRDFGEEE